MGPYAPQQLVQEVNAAWVRFQKINQQLRAAIPAMSQQNGNNFGQIVAISIAVAAAAGLNAIFGGTWLITRELNKSKRLKKLSECIENATKTGLSLEKAQKNCDQLYGKGNGSLINIGGLGVPTKTLLIIGAVFIGGLILYKKL